MSARIDTASELDRLARMLPPWCAHLRHPHQFWPQFDALSGAILARADPADTAYVMERIADMLAANGGRYSKGADWGSYVLTDGTLVTGQNPASSREAADALLKLLKA